MSATRLLVLGVVRILQPAHGYDIRRELMSWQLEDWMNIQPGSIYSALNTLERDGHIAVTAHEKGKGKPARTEYVITAEGEKEFQALLRKAWWTLDPGTSPLVPALCLMPFMDRDELIAALQSRINQLEGKSHELRFARATIKDGATGADGDVPEHVREVIDFATSRLKAEIDWSRTFLKRLRDGEYEFGDEHHLR